MARAEFKVNLKPLQELEKRLNDPALTSALMSVAKRAEVAALVAQAIADNFAKEGPGWAPLKGATIRNSVSLNMATRALLKDAKMQAALKMGAVRKSKSGKYTIDREALKGNKVEFNRHVDKYIEGVERASRVNPDPKEALGNRQILRRTSLLYQTVTTPGFSGSAGPTPKNPSIRPASGQNIYRVEGSKLIWGTNLIYAGVHNEGHGPIPKREFLVLREEWKNRLMNYVKKLMTDTIKDFVEGRK